MPAKNPRINVLLDKRLYRAVQDLASDEGVSMSMVMRDLVQEAIELREDQALAAMAEEREKSFDPGKALSHEEIWSS